MTKVSGRSGADAPSGYPCSAPSPDGLGHSEGIPNAAILDRVHDATAGLTRAEIEQVLALRTEQSARMLCALMLARAVAEEARVEWDEAPQGMKAGKLLIALSGALPGYRDDIDEIHRTISDVLSEQVTA